jgi:hypothetical protein
LYRAALNGLVAAAREVSNSGTFTYVERTLTSAELNEFLRR